jgi:hypothetical protein
MAVGSAAWTVNSSQSGIDLVGPRKCFVLNGLIQIVTG